MKRTTALVALISCLTLAGCTAELAEITIDGSPLQTAAVEATDPEAVLQAMEKLGLGDAENVSYPLAIKRTIGMLPPAEQPS